jgi:hypothetical protein
MKNYAIGRLLSMTERKFNIIITGMEGVGLTGGLKTAFIHELVGSTNFYLSNG